MKIREWKTTLPTHLRTVVQQIETDFSQLPKIVLEFPSAISENQFSEIKIELLSKLRDEFKNDFIQLETKVVHRDSESFIKTKEQVFAELAAKNSVLLKLKDEFGLI